MTTTRTSTARDLLNSGQPGLIAEAAQKVQLGTNMSKIKLTVTGLTSATSFDITTAAFLAKVSTLLGISLKSGETLPPIGEVITLRTTAGTLANGPAIVTDAGGTATAIGTGTAHVVLLSDDGKTLTFQAAVTAFVLTYVPAPIGGADQAMTISAP